MRSRRAQATQLGDGTHRARGVREHAARLLNAIVAQVLLRRHAEALPERPVALTRARHRGGTARQARARELEEAEPYLRELVAQPQLPPVPAKLERLEGASHGLAQAPRRLVLGSGNQQLHGGRARQRLNVSPIDARGGLGQQRGAKLMYEQVGPAATARGVGRVEDVGVDQPRRALPNDRAVMWRGVVDRTGAGIEQLDLLVPVPRDGTVGVAVVLRANPQIGEVLADAVEQLLASSRAHLDAIEDGVGAAALTHPREPR